MEQGISLIKVMLLSAVPIIEQKGAIPFGLSEGFSYLETYILTLIGAVLPAPILLKLVPFILENLKRINILKRPVEWYEARAKKKGESIQQYELLGLFLFVAIPLPGTGVWTGSTIAALLGTEFKKSLFIVLFGAAVCGFIIMLVSMGVISFLL